MNGLRKWKIYCENIICKCNLNGYNILLSYWFMQQPLQGLDADSMVGKAAASVLSLLTSGRYLASRHTS